MSQSDVDAAATGVLDARFALAVPGAAIDYVVVQTCAVTNDAVSASRAAVRRALREHPGARVVAAGCWAELEPEALRALGAAAVVGTQDEAGVPAALARLEAQARSRGGQSTATSTPTPTSTPTQTQPPLTLVDHTRAFLKVQDGCGAHCTYCIVPAARGPARSLPFDEALRRIAALSGRTPEVVLAGVHLGCYGRDLRPARTLEDLVLAAAGQGHCRRLRLSSIEPHELPLALLRAPAAAALCDHLHLPLQSGSPRILRAMARPYSPADYARAVEAAAAALPGACLGADVMAGFPGERDEDHRATLELLQALPIAYLHVFPFSPREGTPAARLPGRVHGAVVRERARELRALSAARWARFLQDQVGRVLEVAVERVAGGVAQGRARNHVPLRWHGHAARRGELVPVRVVRAGDGACEGVPAGRDPAAPARLHEP